MNDPLPVRLVERVRDLDPETQSLLEGEQSLRQPVRQRLALEVLHDEILGLALSPHVVEGADVRVRELRDRLCLPLEPLPRLGRSREMLRQDLDRHRPSEPRVPRPVHLSHSSRA